MLVLLKRLIQFHEWVGSSGAFLLQVRVVWSVLCSREICRATRGPWKAFLVSLDQPSVPPGCVHVSPCLVHLSIYPSCAQSCPTLCNPVNARFLCPWDFSSQEYLSGLPFPPPGDLPNTRIKLVSPALQVDSLLLEPLGSPICLVNSRDPLANFYGQLSHPYLTLTP